MYVIYLLNVCFSVSTKFSRLEHESDSQESEDSESEKNEKEESDDCEKTVNQKKMKKKNQMIVIFYH
jgi:hypothetical protein